MEPSVLGNLRIKKRFAMSPMGPFRLGDAVGGWNARGIEYDVAHPRSGHHSDRGALEQVRDLVSAPTSRPRSCGARHHHVLARGHAGGEDVGGLDPRGIPDAGDKWDRVP